MGIVIVLGPTYVAGLKVQESPFPALTALKDYYVLLKEFFLHLVEL